MFCFQCQEAAKNEACTVRGVCGKEESTAALQDLLIFQLKGIARIAEKSGKIEDDKKLGRFFSSMLFSTITNVNFDDNRFLELIQEADKLRKDLLKQAQLSDEILDSLPEACRWEASSPGEIERKAGEAGILSEKNEDIRSLQELMLYGLKGIAAYTHHAEVLGYENGEIYDFYIKALSSTTEEKTAEELTALVLETGAAAVTAMELLDTANTKTFGNPEITKVNIGVGSNPGILVSGHDLKDFDELLKQTEGTGVDIYTHGEMLPAHYYPAFKKYDHFVGNYGGSWWKQNKEFDTFNGPIIMTTNCITPVKDSYKDRIYTTDVVGYPGVKHLPDRKEGGSKDFSEVIEQAKKSSPPREIETGEIVGGFAHNQVTELADKVVEAVKSGAIKRFVVMAGCDGRQSGRNYFTDVAEALPEDAVILTAGCAKYRYNKLDLGDIGGIPRVLDAGQCNDSYSLAVIALKLKEAFELEDINDLPLSFDIAWYEQKAVTVLLALLHLGFKGIRLGPTLPAFLSPNVAQILVDTFDIKPITEASADAEAIMAGA